MLTVAEKTNEIRKQVINNFSLLSLQQQSEVAEEINRMLRMKRIKDLEDAIVSDDMTMEDIVAITRKIRKEINSGNEEK